METLSAGVLTLLVVAAVALTGCEESKPIVYEPIAKYEYKCEGIGTYNVYKMRDEKYTGGLSITHLVDSTSMLKIGFPSTCVVTKLKDMNNGY